ncbi:hypothetical protein [Roseovarius sp. M141]|uniref:hypothetical protein n=1 Tax=Roseovarius sp. M141 TaxID=2583806 RepID=UPI0020CD2A45|nr:hypothetical protein [Roseovarius sp. M141]MCQ0090538.1 hypothetical protein [Roseovarius sp. M141]
MTGTLARSSDQKSDIVISGSDGVVPLSSRELFWRARYLRAGQAAGHLPLLFWLVADLRPRHAVTLQIDSGVLHFGLCQAIDKVGYDALCHGFGAWPPKDPSGKVPEALATYHASEYEDISRLSVGTPLDVQHLFNAHSLDLLIVESGITAELVKTLVGHWLPKMSDRGVVVLCGTADIDTETSIQLSDLRRNHAHAHFDHSGGLDIIVAGSKTSDRLARLVDLDRDESAQMAVQRIFARLGGMHLNEWTARDKTNWARRLNATVDEAKAEATALQAERDTLAERLDKLDRAYDQRQLRTASLEQTLADWDAVRTKEQETLAQARKDLGAQKAALEVVQVNLKAAEAAKQTALAQVEEERAALKSAQADRDAALAQAQESVAAKADKDAAMTQVQQDFAAQKTTLEAKLAERDAADAERQAAMAQMQQDFAAQEAALADTRLKSSELVLTMTQALETAKDDALVARAQMQQDFDAQKATFEAKLADRDAVDAERDAAMTQMQQDFAAQKATLESRLADRDAAVGKSQAVMAQMQRDLAAEKAALAQARQKSSELVLTMTQALEATEGDALVARKALKSTEKALQQGTDERTSALMTLTAELEALQTARTQQHKDLREQAAYADKLRKMIQTHEKTIQRQDKQIAALEKDREAHINLREQMKDSTSWRVTAPLRRVRNIFDRD